MYRNGNIFWNDKTAGLLSEQEEGYVFQYYESYLADPGALAASFTLPLRTGLSETVLHLGLFFFELTMLEQYPVHLPPFYREYRPDLLRYQLRGSGHQQIPLIVGS